MKSSNVKHPIEWKHVQISEFIVNGVKLPILVDIKAPSDGLFLVTMDREGNIIEKVQLPINDSRT